MPIITLYNHKFGYVINWTCHSWERIWNLNIQITNFSMESFDNLTYTAILYIWRQLTEKTFLMKGQFTF